jgi:hypothetical protein
MGIVMPKTNTDFFIEFQKPLVLIVHPDIFTLDEAKKELQTKFNWTVLSIGQVLSRDMITGQVSGAAGVQAWLSDQVRGTASGPILVSDIDLLFEPSFKLDPLIIFQRASRFTKLIVLWPGMYSKDIVLSYAVPEHRHYRTWRNPDAEVFPL